MNEPPRSIQFDDVYFSADGGPEETIHVFCDGNNLPARWQGRDRFTIGETGFGTGLNFLLAWELFERTAEQGAFLDFVSVEKFPMSVEDIRKGLAPWAERLSPYLDKMLAQYPLRVPGFHRLVFDGRVALTLIFGDANDVFPEVEGRVDAWFLDGFTPAKNPDMWTDHLFAEMARLSRDGTTFATFTAAGFVKRGLNAAGFTVNKIKGFGRKRDMLAGVYTKPDKPAKDSPVSRHVKILGAGLAGTACAFVLRQYGFEPVLYDPNGVASGSSGNPIGLINPRFTAFRTPESDFYTAAFAQTVRTFPVLDADYERSGSLHLITDEDKEKRLTRTAENWGWPTEHMHLLPTDEASTIAGIALGKSALYLADSAQVNPAALCAQYADGVEVRKEKPDIAGQVVFANGIGALEHYPDLPIHTVRGQMIWVEPNAHSMKLRCNLSYGGYISAPRNGRQAIGATFQKWLGHNDTLEDDTRDILTKLTENVPAIGGDFKILDARASLRTSSHDRFPIIGPVAENQFITTAHGSHGIASTLAGAHLLADFLRGGVRSLGKDSVKALSPLRFSARAAKKLSS